MNSTQNFYLNLAWIFTIICWVLAMVGRSYPLKKLGGLGQPLPNPAGLVVSILCYVPFSGLRTENGDTIYYALSYDLTPKNGTIDVEFGGDCVYPLISEIIKETIDDFHYVVFICAAIALIPVLFTLYKYSHPYDLAIYLFMATGYFGLSMNGIRQYMAAGVLLLGTKYMFSLKKGAFIKYAAIVFLCFLMHKSALIMLFVFIFVRRKAWRASSFMLIFFSIVILLIFDLVLPGFLGALEDTSYSGYAENGWFTSGEEGGSSFIRVFIAVVPLVISYFSRAQMRRLGHIGDILTNLAFMNMALYIISIYNWIFARLAIYTTIYYIILLAWVVYNGVQKKDRGLYYVACVIGYYFYSKFQDYTILHYMSDIYFPNRKFF